MLLTNNILLLSHKICYMQLYAYHIYSINRNLRVCEPFYKQSQSRQNFKHIPIHNLGINTISRTNINKLSINSMPTLNTQF